MSNLHQLLQFPTKEITYTYIINTETGIAKLCIEKLLSDTKACNSALTQEDFAAENQAENIYMYM